MAKDYELRGRLMGSDLNVAIIADSAFEAAEGYARALAIGESLEARFSRFRPDSELSKLNREGEIESSLEFLEALEIALALNKETDGAFNPLLSVARLGYDRDFASVPRPGIVAAKTPTNTEISSIKIDKTNRRITLAPEQTLDFGGFMKGYAAQKMCDSLSNFQGAIVGIGGDIFTHGVGADGKEFEFAVWNPIAGEDGPKIKAKDAAICTSGTYKRYWEVGGKPTHHILGADGQSSQSDLVSATVIAKSGTVAEGYATAAIAIGAEAAAEALQARGLSYAFVCVDGSINKTNDFSD